MDKNGRFEMESQYTQNGSSAVILPQTVQTFVCFIAWVVDTDRSPLSALEQQHVDLGGKFVKKPWHYSSPWRFEISS